ncbi:MAG TPA: SpoIVB peptidase S55 domain-containing protein [bacterium]|nr:SpoIVB peptidase S55 domain-containing protein [bacterium]
MKRRAGRGGSIVLVLLLSLVPGLTGSTRAESDGPFVPLSEITPGMICTGYSCFSGTDLETLTVEILGIIQSGTPEDSVIIGKVDSPSVRRGGIMSGMSGSPVYYNGRLVGAMATAYPYATEPICGITPVDAMTRLWDLEKAPGRQGFRPPRRDLLPFADPVEGMPAGLKPIGLTAGVHGMPFRDITDVLLKSTGISTTGHSGIMTDDRPGELKPGSPVGVGLITGDMQLVAFGTVTHVDGNRILAFGHGSFGLGKCALPLVSSSVVSFVPNQVVSFKLTNAGQPIGTLTFDAPSGVTGVLGQTAPTIPVDITIRGLSQEPVVYHIRAADHEFLSTPFIAQAAAGAVQRLGVTWGDMSIQSELKIRTREAGTVTRRDMIGSIDSIWSAVRESFDLLEKIHQNPLQKITIEHVDYQCSLAQESRIMTLDSIAVKPRKYHPGETMEITLSFHGDRIDAMDRKVTLSIPENTPPGQYHLHVLDPADYRLVRAIHELPAHRHRSLEAYFNMLQDRLAGNQVMVALADTATDIRSGNRILPDVPPLLEHVYGMPGTGIQTARSLRFLVSSIVTLDHQVIGSHKVPVTLGVATESEP